MSQLKKPIKPKPYHVYGSIDHLGRAQLATLDPSIKVAEFLAGLAPVYEFTIMPGRIKTKAMPSGRKLNTNPTEGRE